MPAIATAAAMLPFAARRFGERDVDGIRRGVREAHVAGLGYLALVAPILFALSGPIAGALSHSAVTRDYATFGLRIIPLACIASLPLFLCRPVFEGLGRGRPGLLMALFRYLLLTAPAGWAGMTLAARLGYPGLYGLLLGLIAAAGLSSAIFFLWTRRVLRIAAGAPAPGSLTPSSA
jgi:Na+-driven multidrug efflux pump